MFVSRPYELTFRKSPTQFGRMLYKTVIRHVLIVTEVRAGFLP